MRDEAGDGDGAAKLPAGAAILLFCFAGPARAQETGNARKLTLKEAVNLAVGNSRELTLARLRYGLLQRQAGVDAVGLPPESIYGNGRGLYQRVSITRGRRRTGHFFADLQSADFQSSAERRPARRRAAGAGPAAFDRKHARRRDGARARWSIWNWRRCGMSWN